MLISLSLKSVYHMHFCHACLNLLMDELAIAQCSSFVKNYEWIPAMYFVAMFECCSIIILLHLDGYLLFIADRCHICFACHFQTVTPIPAFFISFSSDFISSFQWHTWISKLRPGSIFSFPKHAYALHITSRISCHVLHHVACAFLVVDCGSVCLCSCLG